MSNAINLEDFDLLDLEEFKKENDYFDENPGAIFAKVIDDLEDVKCINFPVK